jgi:uncharacterized surface protein with fasciclin (FAS1) repeats
LAPTNTAFDDIIHTKYWSMLVSSPWILHLRHLLAFHVTVPHDDGLQLRSTDWVDGQRLHMLNNEDVTIHDMKRGISVSTTLLWTENANIVEADMMATNGVVHTIDTVLFPTFVEVDVLALGKYYHNDFQILTTLLESIGLVGIRSEFTLFAPTDAAFKALGKKELDELRNNSTKLRKLLVNHVVFGVQPSVYFTDGLILTSLGGRNITITISGMHDMVTTDIVPTMPDRMVKFKKGQDSPLQVNGVSVLYANVLANNGLAHVIDQLLFDDLSSFTSS